MTENRLDIQTKRTDFQTDSVLLLEQVTEEKEKAHPSHFLKTILASPHRQKTVFYNNVFE